MAPSTRERLDCARGTNEARHDGEPDQEENRLQDIAAGLAEVEQAGERPAARERRAEHLGTDQDRRAHHGEHVDPDDAARRPHALDRPFHAFSLAVSAGRAERGGNLVQSAGPIKPAASEPPARFSLPPPPPPGAPGGACCFVVLCARSSLCRGGGGGCRAQEGRGGVGAIFWKGPPPPILAFGEDRPLPASGER